MEKPGGQRTPVVGVALNPTRLAANQRGLVISSPIFIEGNSLSAKGELDRQELRLSLLFWDVLDYPRNFLFSSDGDDEADFLERSGVLRRSESRLLGGGGQASNLFALGHVGVFRGLDQREPGQWSLARGERSFSFSDQDFSGRRGILFELHSCLPVPSQDVPLEDVLNFKEKRLPELLSLRHSLEDIYQEITSSPDPSQALSTRKSKLDRSIADHIAASRETTFPLRLTNIKARLDWKTFASGLATFQATALAGLPLTTAALSGLATAAAASCSADVSLANRRESSSPFEYISSFHSELFR